jgi:hypothetical protein
MADNNFIKTIVIAIQCESAGGMEVKINIWKFVGNFISRGLIYFEQITIS